MKKFHIIMTILLIFFPSVSYAFLNDIIDSAQKGLDTALGSIQGVAPGSNGGINQGIKGTMLDNIFVDHTYDEDIPFHKQFPRVALTILSSPEFHAEMPAYAPSSTNYKSGCYEVKAKIWHSSEQSTDIEKVVWCSPDNIATGIPLRGAIQWWSGTTILHAKLAKYEKNNGPVSTGKKRTEGPIPPDAPIPDDIVHQKYYSASMLSANTYDGMMVASILYQMGFDWSYQEDRRVWIVKFNGAKR